MSNQLEFGFSQDPEPAPQWIEDLLAEMERQDLLNANGEILIVEIVPAIDLPVQPRLRPEPFPDPISAALSRLSARN